MMLRKLYNYIKFSHNFLITKFVKINIDIFKNCHGKLIAIIYLNIIYDNNQFKNLISKLSITDISNIFIFFMISFSDFNMSKKKDVNGDFFLTFRDY